VGGKEGEGRSKNSARVRKVGGGVQEMKYSSRGDVTRGGEGVRARTISNKLFLYTGDLWPFDGKRVSEGGRGQVRWYKISGGR